MNRTILTARDLVADFPLGGAPNAPAPASGLAGEDSYVDRLVKLIPAEIIAVWITVRGVLSATENVPPWLPWAALLVLLALTPLYLRRVARVAKWRQVWLTTLAFVVWSYSLGGVPFAALPAPYYMPVYAAVLLPLYTFALPMLEMG